MRLSQFVYTLSRLIEKYGITGKITVSKKNEYGEPVEDIPLKSLKGLFHTSTRFLSINLTDSGQVPTQRQLKFLVLFVEEIAENQKIEIDGTPYRISGVDDLGGLHLCLDLSLEVLN